MTLDKKNDSILEEIYDMLNQGSGEGWRPILEYIFNKVMGLERKEALGADSYERSRERKGYANGYKKKRWDTRLGRLDLRVPQTRGVSFYPSCLEKGSRSERALKVAVAEMYLKGVSTRRVEKITQELCGLEISSNQVSAMTQELDEEFTAFRERRLGEYSYLYLDALYLKIRHGGSVRDQAVLIAVGVNTQGKREILAVSATLSEAEVHWRTFLESLLTRGLVGVELVISDDHAGLQAARQKVFGSVPYQRCQFHMHQNALKYAPKRAFQETITRAMREIFSCTTRRQVEETKKEIVSSLEKSAPEFVRWFEEHIEEGLTCLAFPEEHRKRIRTTNGLERVNREVKRRTRVAVLFPNVASALRLVTGVLMEIHEDWVTGKSYLDMSLLEKKRAC